MLIYLTIIIYKKHFADKNYLSKWEWSINNPKKFQVNLYDAREIISPRIE
jgi:hypothetical protein